MTLEGLASDNWEQVEPAAKEAIASSYDVPVTNIEIKQAEDIIEVEIETETDLDAQVLSNTIQGIAYIHVSYLDYFFRYSHCPCST